MACSIINSKHVKVNGGSTLYGGAITNVSLNFGGLSSGHRASVTVVKQAGSLQTPGNQDSVTLSLLGLSLQMHVGGYNLSTKANSATQLTIDLYDQSNKYLDHDFIVLSEEFPKSEAKDNVHIIGDKYGTIPHKETAEVTGSIVPDADTKWGSIRKFFSTLKSPSSFFGGGDTLLGGDGVDSLVKSASGKSSYYTESDTDGDGKTLRDVIGNLIIGSFENASFDFTGSFREVIVSVCNALGYFAYWDMSASKVKIAKNFNSGAGRFALDRIARSCNAISSSSSENFTVTSTQSAVGSFSSSDPGETSRMYGAGVTRYYEADLLQPDFHYTTCSKPEEFKVIDFEDEDTLKAIAAAENDKVYAMYVFQTMLSENSGNLEFDVDVILQLNGAANEKKKIQGVGKEEFKAGEAAFTKNTFFVEYYSGDAACSGSVYSVVPQGDKSLEQFEKTEKDWNKKPKQDPVAVAGKSKTGVFENGYMVIHDIFKFNSILDENSKLAAQDDILRNYLNAIVDFRNRFYVIREQLNLRSIVGNKNGFNYRYYMSSSTAGSSANFNVENGYNHISINPYLSLNDAGGELKALGKTVHAMYVRSGNSDDFLSSVPVVDFIRALDKNELKDLAKSPNSYCQSNVVNQNKLSSEASDVPAVNMHLIVKEQSSSSSIFADEKNLVFGAGKFTNKTVVNNLALAISERITTIGFEEADGILFKMFEPKVGVDRYDLLAVTDEDIANSIFPIQLESDPLEKIKMQYYVEGLQATIAKSTGYFSISASDVKKDKNAWSGSLVQNISINASDIGTTNDIFNKFAATAADDSYIYSKENQNAMKKALNRKVQNNTWIDNESAQSQSLEFVLNGDVTLPTIEQGLQSLSVQSSDGNIIVNVSVGNENAKKAQMAMRQMKSQGSKLRHGYGSIIPDSTESFSPRFIALVNGILR